VSSISADFSADRLVFNTADMLFLFFCFNLLIRDIVLCLNFILQELLQIQSNPSQATKDLSSSNRGRLLNQVCSSFEESKSFEFDGRLDVLVVAEVF